jgi:hypothetical protein
VDAKFTVRAVDQCLGLFGKAPRAYAYDRAGHSAKNIADLKAKGVKVVGLAARGATAWSVSERVRDELVRERAMVEGGRGTVKSRRYDSRDRVRGPRG